MVQVAPSGPTYLVVEGTYTGAPDYIEAKITQFSGGATVVDWNSLGPPNNGRFRGVLGFTPISPYLQIQVRFHNDPATSASSSAFGVGNIFLVTGQSLAERFVGKLSGGFLAKSGAVSIFVPSAAEANALGLGAFYGWNSAVGDGATTLANAIIGATGMGCGFIMLAKGGTPLVPEAASPPGTQYLLSMEGAAANYYGEAMLLKSLQVLSEASLSQRGPDFAGILHIHGEADASTVQSLTYFRGLSRYFSALRAMINRSPEQCPIWISTVGKSGATDLTAIREAMIQWCRHTPGAIVAGDRYDIPRDDTDGLYVHQSLVGAIRMAKRYGMDINHTLLPGTFTRPGVGPFITKAKRNGTTITLSLDLNGHAGIAAVNGAAPLTGFVVSASPTMSAPITLTNAVVSGSTIVLTAGSNFPAPSYVKFVPTAANATDAATDNNVYSTNAATGDTQGLPLQPTACAIIAA
jgi:hypothetical protein